MDENKKPMRVQIDTNPETGEPVFAWVIKTGYDPQTGEEMFQTVEPTRYDTQTGEPIFDQLADNNPPNQENETGQNGFFNQTNETGQNNFSYQENGFENPGNETAQNAFANYGDFAYQSNPQMEMNNGTKKPKKSKGKKTIFIAAAIAIVALALLGSGAYALVKSGFFLDKYDKILYAAYTTAEDDRIFGNLMDTVQVLENRSIYVKGNMDTHIADTSAKGSVDLALDRSAFEYRADGSFSYNGVSFDGSAYLDREKVQVFCPDLADHIYQLSFDAPEDSFINQTMEENLQMNLKDVSRLIEKFIEQSKDSEQITKDMTKELRTRFKKIQLKENASKNSTSVSGSRTLKGYTLVITKDDFVDMLKIVLETSKRYQNKLPLDDLEAFGLDLDAGDLDRAYDEILNGAEEEIDDFSIDIDIYLYKGEIAEIGFDDGDGNGFRLEMTGEKGAISSNFECTVFFEKRSGYTISRTSEYKNGVESGNLYMKGHIQEYRIDYTYNTNTGEYSIQFPAMEGLPAFQTEGNFHASNREVQFTTNLNVMGQSIDLDLTVGKGADIKALSGGIFEIGDKSEGELESEAMKLQENSVFERIFD